MDGVSMDEVRSPPWLKFENQAFVPPFPPFGGGRSVRVNRGVPPGVQAWALEKALRQAWRPPAGRMG